MHLKPKEVVFCRWNSASRGAVLVLQRQWLLLVQQRHRRQRQQNLKYSWVHVHGGGATCAA